MAFKVDYSQRGKRGVAAAGHHPATLLDRRKGVQRRLSDHLTRQQRRDAWEERQRQQQQQRVVLGGRKQEERI